MTVFGRLSAFLRVPLLSRIRQARCPLHLSVRPLRRDHNYIIIRDDIYIKIVQSYNYIIDIYRTHPTHALHAMIRYELPYMYGQRAPSNGGRPMD